MECTTGFVEKQQYHYRFNKIKPLQDCILDQYKHLNKFFFIFLQLQNNNPDGDSLRSYPKYYPDKRNYVQ